MNSKPLDPVYFRSGIAQIEALAAHDPATRDLMERAGLLVAQMARDLMSGNEVLVLAGPGNNGGDALVAARHLASWQFKVTLVFSGEPERLPAAAAGALAAWVGAGGQWLSDIPSKERWALVIDGLFGVGLNRSLDVRYQRLIETVNSLAAPVLSIDIPSGLSADTGVGFGPVIRAAHTLTFIAYKPGLFIGDGPDHCGRIRLETLGVAACQLLSPNGWALNSGCIEAALAPRPRNSHKGLFGSVGVVGGARGMVGAAVLCARAALKMGAGRVHLGLLFSDAIALDFAQPELMLSEAQALLEAPVDVFVAGPGLGRSSAARGVLEALLGTALPLVLDADALNLIAQDESLKRSLRERVASSVLTPHPLEAARLLGCTAGEIQSDRVGAALRIAELFECHLVLKGVGSVCAFSGGGWAINTSGNPGMASAGMGDVLSGMIGAYLAQGALPAQALSSAVYLHGAAADSLVDAGVGPVGLTASEVIDEARTLLNRSSRTRPAF